MAEYSSPLFINAVPLGLSSLESTLLVRSIQTAFFVCSGSHCISVPLENGARVLREFKITFDSGEEGPKKARVSETGSGVLTRVRFLHCVH